MSLMQMITVYRRSPHFVIFGTKMLSRNSGITNFETLLSTKIPNWVQNFSKVPIFSYFSRNYQGYFYRFIKLFMKILKQMLKRFNNKNQGTGSPPLVWFLLVWISNQYGFLYGFSVPKNRTNRNRTLKKFQKSTFLANFH